jgi:alkylated DNA repair dioxygenase AlkB
LAYFFCEEEKPAVEISQPVRHGYLIRYAFTRTEVDHYFAELSKLPWRIQEIIVAGKHYMPMRETLGFADEESSRLLENRSTQGILYSKIFTQIRRKIRDTIQNSIHEIDLPLDLNYCWGNRYRDGRDKVGKHKDNERGHSTVDPIVSVSFGIARHFDIYRDQQIVDRVDLGHGDIFLMMPGFQQAYYHGVPKQLRVREPRINLTFRSVDTTSYNTDLS